MGRRDILVPIGGLHRGQEVSPAGNSAGPVTSTLSDDDVAIWNVVLTEAEVNQAMDKVFPVEALDKLPVRWGELKRRF